MIKKIPKILIDSMANGNWKKVDPIVLRRSLGEELHDLQLFESVVEMEHVLNQLDFSGIVDLPGFCMTREHDVGLNDPRLEYSRALLLGGSIIPGDDVFIAIRLEDSDDYDPPVLVFDDRKRPPNRWTQRGKLSDLIRGICSECWATNSPENSFLRTESPAVARIEWGMIEVDRLGTFRDVKLYPGGGRAWDWRETDTHHVPGIQPSDIQELLDNGSEFIVLSRGMQLVLQTCPETIEKLNELSVPHVIEETKAAVGTYNRLVNEGKAVGGLFHSTC